MTTQTTETSDAAAPTSGGSLPALLLEQADRRSKGVAIRAKELGRWRQYTWADYVDRVSAIAAGLASLGVSPGDKVSVHSENRPEWLFADLAVQGIGGITVGIYPTSPASEVEYLLDHSQSVVVFAEDEEQLDKALAVRDRLTRLRKIVLIDPRGIRDLDPAVMTLDQLEELGRSGGDPVAAYRERVTSVTPSDIAVIVYTSGTTGPPKGAMLAHANLLAAASSASAIFGVGAGDEVLSYLPLSHVAERLISGINAIASGYVVNFGEGGESFINDIREVQPTFFLGVPRVWEKMMAGVQIRVADASRIKRANYRFWLRRGERLARVRWRRRLGPFGKLTSFLGWLFLYRSVREKLGLLRVRSALSGAAPIAPQVLEFFWALGVPVREGYGQTENTAQATITPLNDVRIGKVGKAAPGVEVRIADDGEILTRGAGTFAGYFRNEEATRETIDGDGWLHTGDVGELDEEGFLAITDRKKDIIITAGGKNVSPSEVENKLKVSPYVREAVVIGDRRKYLTALIGIEGDTVGDWAGRKSLAFTTYADLSEKPEVVELIGEWVDQVNRELAQVETIKQFRLLPKELDHEEGELTATQKVKRRAIEDQFGDLIASMYR
jgi:long-chain acyl-CoA synthetase